MGVTGPPHPPTPHPVRSPAHRPSAQHPLEEGLWGAGPQAAPVPRGLSLPLVAMHRAQLLGVPDVSSATRLPGTNLVLLLFSQAMAETTPISRPLSSVSAPELMSMRSCSKEEQGLDLAGHKPFPGVQGCDFSSRSLEESQSVTRAIDWDGRCQETAMEITQPLKNKGAQVALTWWKGWSFSDLEHFDLYPLFGGTDHLATQ